MFIPYVEIKGHHQFSLPEIIKIEAEFTSPTQIIIGTNGAGKTTLLREINPLPAQASDYQPGGYKRVVCLHQNRRYFLESNFGKPVKHIFEVDGENLNISGKETEQRKLVKDHFGLTPQLMKMATGEIQFSKLSSQARRDWLMSISGMNFEYAMQFFQRVKDFNRESTTLVKSMAVREADEIEKLSQIGDVSELKLRAEELSKVITKLMRLQSPVKPKTETQIKTIIASKLFTIKKDGLRLVANLPRQLAYRFENIEDLDSLKVHAQTLLKQSDHYRQELNELYRKKDDLVKLAERTREQGLSLEDEMVEINKLREEIAQLEANDKHRPLFDIKAVTYFNIEEFTEKYRMAAEAYVNNTDLKFSSDYNRALQSELTAVNLKVNDLNKTINGYDHAIKHHNEAPDADCPECGTHFKIGNAVVEIEKLSKLKSEDEDSRDALLTVLEKTNEQLAEFQEYVQCRRNLFTLLEANDSPMVRELRSNIAEREQHGIGTRGLYDVYEEWVEKMTLSKQLLKLREDLERREFTLKHLMEVEELRKHYEGTQLDDIDVEIDRLIRAVDAAKNEIKDAEQLVKESTEQLQKLNHLWEIHESIGQDLKDYHFYHEQTLINETLLTLQTELAGIQSTVSKVDSIQHTIDNLGSYRAEYDINANASKKLMDFTSPNTGLIAEHVLGFLEDFVEEINRFIREVWEYDMQVLPCKIDAETIDYRFPVKIENSPIPRKDIAETSKGQLAIIDLVFRLAIISSVEKCVLPLYLDEPTEGFDEQHCENFVRFIKGYLEQGATEQVLMISHDFAGHASFTNAETMVIDEKNVLNKPPRYNQHVKFYYS